MWPTLLLAVLIGFEGRHAAALDAVAPRLAQRRASWSGTIPKMAEPSLLRRAGSDA